MGWYHTSLTNECRVTNWSPFSQWYVLNSSSGKSGENTLLNKKLNTALRYPSRANILLPLCLFYFSLVSTHYNFLTNVNPIRLIGLINLMKKREANYLSTFTWHWHKVFLWHSSWVLSLEAGRETAVRMNRVAQQQINEAAQEWYWKATD